MDKKNTMLLTVIAVATLLVAVVGATFAYFSVTGSTTSSTNTLTTTTKEVGTVTLTGSTANFYLNPTAAQMAQRVAPKTVYSTTDNEDAAETVSEHLLATFALANAHSGDTYYCTFDWTLRTTSSSANYVNLNTADGDVKFTLGSGVSGINSTYTLAATKYDTTANPSQDGVSGTGAVQLTADSNGAASTTITGHAEWHNIDGDQNNRQQLNMSTVFNITNFSCDTAQAPQQGSGS